MFKTSLIIIATWLTALIIMIGIVKISNAESASYYGKQHAGNKTASGEIFNPGALTAAHKSLPFGTKVKVTNLNNGKSVIVRINDRGPFVKGRTIDLSYAAAKQIGMLGSGTVKVNILVLA